MKNLLAVLLLAILTCPVMAQTEPFKGGPGGGQAAVTSSPIPLPVELVALSGARKADNQVQLRWTTASERDNAGFEVWRMEAADSWYKIGFVRGKGTSYAANQYSFLDTAPLSATAYYRLKQLDNDGKSTFSKIIAVIGAPQQTQATAWPIPAQSVVTVKAANPEAPALLKLYSAERHLHVQRSFENSMQLDLSQLSDGVYLLHVVQANQNPTVIKLIKAE